LLLEILKFEKIYTYGCDLYMGATYSRDFTVVFVDYERHYKLETY